MEVWTELHAPSISNQTLPKLAQAATRRSQPLDRRSAGFRPESQYPLREISLENVQAADSLFAPLFEFLASQDCTVDRIHLEDFQEDLHFATVSTRAGVAIHKARRSYAPA